MSNNRDDKFDESEYHFSDEDVSYEVESEVPKPASSSSGQQAGGIVSRLGAKRRMLISAAVFIAIVFVVYKVVSPGSSNPPTNITAVPAVVQQAPRQAAPAPQQTAPVQAQAVPAQQAAAPVADIPQQQAVMQPPVMQAAPVQAIPPVIPVQSPASAAQSPAAAMGAYIEDKSAELNAASQQAMSQMQTQYTQQVNEFTMQTKSMQAQIQSLNTRVADMEAQINQLVQVLTRRNQNVSNPNSGSSMNGMPSSSVQHERSPEVKVAYNVQAIIPGRAWLKAENGETLTVAEGDLIRNVGRVTKIDPYDGVVEINTGSKAVSLSYGNGG